MASHSENFDNDDQHGVIIAKGVTMVVLCLVSILMGVIPIKIGKCCFWATKGNPRSVKIVGMMLGFGGGILLCTTFLHMLPEVNEHVQDLKKDKVLPDKPYPYAEIFACAGFFMMYFVEEVIHTRLRRREADANPGGTNKDTSNSTNELVENGHVCSVNVHTHSSYGHGHSHLPAVTKTDDNREFWITSMRGLLIVLGLSVHELVEGLAIGLESSKAYVWYMFGAVAAHKFVIAFCIGVELVASKTHQYLSIVYVCTFAVVSPVGIGIGILLTSASSTGHSDPGIVPVVLQGLAAGTLLYVVFFEILHHNRDGLHQYLSILVGFLFMAGIQFMCEYEYSTFTTVDSVASSYLSSL